MGKCIESILVGGEDVEVLVIDDGSTDDTYKVAKAYEEKYPSIVRAIHQENKGHGGAVNTGLKEASGLYFKVVDSDDWIDQDGFLLLLNKAKELLKKGRLVDMFLTNFVYDNAKRDHHRRMVYTAFFDEADNLNWSDMKHHIKGFNILMHSVTFRTSMLKYECNLRLPEHTFYVDNLFVYLPLPYVQTICYINTTLYHYFIGRNGQSIEEQTMVNRFDQQLKVNYLMVDSVDLRKIKNKDLRKYMTAYLEMITVITSCISYISHDSIKMRKTRQLWKYIRKKDYLTWRKMRYGVFGNAVNIPTPPGRSIGYGLYKIAQRFIGFN